MVRIIFFGSFLKMYNHLLKELPELEDLVNNRRKIFANNPKDTRLKNHKLSGKMKGQFAFSITGDIRIVYEVIGKNTVRFLAIGPHEKVY